jgi:hypothetical protein
MYWSASRVVDEFGSPDYPRALLSAGELLHPFSFDPHPFS